MGKVLDPSCAYGDCPTDDALHTFFHCERWCIDRWALQSDLGVITPENIIRMMLHGKEEWAKVTGFIEAVLPQKKQEIDAGPAREEGPTTRDNEGALEGE